jgi:RNA polymerase sigma factor (sigma-70 family)
MDNLHQQLKDLHQESFGWALRCCVGYQDEAEDVLQTVYLKILEGKAIFKGKSTFRTWLFSIIRFTAIDAMRRDKVRQKNLDLVKVEWERSTTDTQETETENQEALADDLVAFQKILNELPGRQREVLQLVFYHDCTIAEAAAVMGVSLGSARTHYERAKGAFRKKLTLNAIVYER